MTAEASGTQDFGYRDLTPVAAVAQVCLVVVARGDAGWTSVSDIAASRNGDPVIAGVTIGGASHMGLLKAAELGGVEIRPVQVGGTSDSFAALLGKQIDLMIAPPSTAKDYFYAKDGSKLENPDAVPLLYLGADRHPSLPDIESMKDQKSDDQLPFRQPARWPAQWPFWHRSSGVTGS